MKTFKLGGIHPEENKFANVHPIEIFPLPKQATIFLGQHLGVPSVVTVEKGDKVKVGQLIGKAEAFISANVHAPVSGTVVKIEPIADITGYKRNAVIIDTEGDEWMNSIDTSPDIIREITLDKFEIIHRMKSCGIVGLGGACFPTHIKYMIPPDKKVEFIIINGAECEPYITNDHRLMLEHPEQCLIGIRAMMIASKAPEARIGIEINKSDAIKIFSNLVKDFPGIKVVPLKTKYPQGAEKQLIKALTNRAVPNGKLPIEVGCIVNNMSTAYAVYEAVQKNKPIVETVTTVSGKSLENRKNYRIRIGTPIMDVLKSVGIPENTGKIIWGGPMMGKSISNTQAYAMKGMSSLLFMSDLESKRSEISNCLRCGKCVSACPMGLEPYLLQTYAELRRYEQCADNGIMNCMECGSCSFGCPSHRPLLDYIRAGKVKTGLMLRNRKS
ncbi:MAG: electron transport complex subunit RsxC [Bacteroidales bacterium]